MNQLSEKRFQHMRVVDNVACIYDSKTDDVLKINDIINKLNEFNEQLQILKEEIEPLKQKEEVLNKIWRIYLENHE